MIFFLPLTSRYRVNSLWPGFQLGPSRAELDGPLGEERTCMSRCAWHGMGKEAIGNVCICGCMNKSSSFFLPFFHQSLDYFTMP